MLAIYIENKVEDKDKVIDFLNHINYFDYTESNLRCKSFFYINNDGSSYISDSCPFTNDNFLYSSSNLPEITSEGIPLEIDLFIRYWKAYYAEFPESVKKLDEKLKKTYGEISVNLEYYRYYLNKISYYYDHQYKPYNSIFIKPYEALTGYNVICNNLEQVKALQRFFIDAGFIYDNKFHYSKTALVVSAVNRCQVNLNSFKFFNDTILSTKLQNVSYCDFVKYYLKENSYNKKFYIKNTVVQIRNREEFDEICDYLNTFVANEWTEGKCPEYDIAVTGIVISKSDGMHLVWWPLGNYVTAAEFIKQNFKCKLFESSSDNELIEIADLKTSDTSINITDNVLDSSLKFESSNNCDTISSNNKYTTNSSENNNLNINYKDMNNTPTNKKSMSSTIVEKFKSQFLPVKDDNLRMTMDGHICAKIGDDYISINKDSELVSYPEEMCIDFPVYVISKQAKDVKVGDIIKTAKSYAVVTEKNENKKSFKCISFSGYITNKKEVKDFLLNTSLVKTVFNMFNSNDSSFNPMMLMLMGDGNMNMKDIMMMQMMTKNGNMNMNPMMLMLMSDKEDNSSMMEMMLMSQMMNGSTNMFNMFGSNNEEKTKSEE